MTRLAQALAGQAAAFQEQFVQHLHAGAFSYASIEATLTWWLQNLPAEISFIAADPQFLLGLVIAPVIAPAFVLFAAFWLAVFAGLAGLGLLEQQLAPLLASFGI